MKLTLKYLFLLLSVFIIRNSVAQPYKSLFGENTTSWNVLIQPLDGGFKHDSLYTSGDTIIKSKIYLKVRNRRYNGNDVLWGFTRQDSIYSKAWFKGYALDTTERVIYDLNLTLGDTFYLEEFPQTLIVDSVFIDNESRKNILFKNVTRSYDSTLLFIEGIGPHTGIDFRMFEIVKAEPYLLCSFKDGSSVYYNKNELFSDKCGFYTNIDQINYQSGIEIASKSHNIIMIKNNEVDDYKYWIFDNLGRLKEFKGTNKLLEEINISHYKNGVFYLIVIDQKNNYYRHKFIKQ